MNFTQRVDAASNTRWVDNRLVPLHKPQRVRVAFWQPHEHDGGTLEWFPYFMARADAAATIRLARREGRMVEASVHGYEIQR